MSRNPTLQVVWLPKARRMDEAMAGIRETRTFGAGPARPAAKAEAAAFDRQKFDVLLKRSLAGPRLRGARARAPAGDPLDEVGFQRQLEEIDVLVDIIKRTGNAAQRRAQRPLVHVPLPREFFELKPLVPFRSVAVKPKRRDLGAREAPRAPAPQVPQEAEARPEPRVVDRAVSAGPEEPAEVAEPAKARVDKATLTTESPAERAVVRREKGPQKAEPLDDRLLKEMSTIASDRVPSGSISSFDSFDIISFTEPPEATDADDLYLVDNSWTVLDLHSDPLANATQVVVRPKSPKSGPEPVEEPVEEPVPEVAKPEVPPPADKPAEPSRPKHKRSKSHKRSKRSVPELQLSDYKGFYVVHTTNDWSFS